MLQHVGHGFSTTVRISITESYTGFRVSLVLTTTMSIMATTRMVFLDLLIVNLLPPGWTTIAAQIR